MRTLLLLGPRNSLATQQTTLFGSIPVKLDRAVLGRVAARGENAESLQDADGAGAVVIRSGRREKGEEIVGRILMRAKDGQGLRSIADLWLKARDDGRLGERVSEVLEGDVGVERRILDDLRLDCVSSPNSSFPCLAGWRAHTWAM